MSEQTKETPWRPFPGDRVRHKPTGCEGVVLDVYVPWYESANPSKARIAALTGPTAASKVCGPIDEFEPIPAAPEPPPPNPLDEYGRIVRETYIKACRELQGAVAVQVWDMTGVIADLEREIDRRVAAAILKRAGVPLPPETDGVSLIAAERRRQVEKEGWSPENDDGHEGGELAVSAAAYALFAADRPEVARALERQGSCFPLKPKDPIPNLIRAGALVAAEIDRLRRLN